MQTDINNIQHVPLRSLQSSCSHWAESSKYELWSWEHSGSQDWVEHASWPGCSHPPLQGQLELDCSWTFFRLIPDQEEEDGQKGENATAADGARQKHDFYLRPKKDIMHVMFSETLVEWSVCSMFTSVITTGSKYDLNITWNQWCGVCLIVCLCAQSQVELDSMRTNRSYSVEVQAVSYWGQTQFKGPRAVLHFTTQQSTETRTRHRGFFSSSSKFCREEKKTSSCRLKISPKCRSVFRCLGSLWKLPPLV